MKSSPLIDSFNNRLTNTIIFLIAVVLGFFFLPLVFGAGGGYVLGYYLVLKPRKSYPDLYPLPLKMWRFILLGIAFSLILAAYFISLSSPITNLAQSTPWFANIPISICTLWLFIWWRKNTMIRVREDLRHGSARLVTKGELKPYSRKGEYSVYIGGKKYFYSKQGHLLTVAGTRSGKFTDLLCPNLLGAGGSQGSILCVDPKGELAAVTHHYQKSQGRKVRIINPWGLFVLGTSTYNPLDLLDPDSEHLPDDTQLIAQMIVPTQPGKEDHWNNRARAQIAGHLMHMAVNLPREKLTLGELWRRLRLSQDDSLEVLKEMARCTHPISGSIIRGAANEILQIMENSEKEAAGIISTTQRWTDIFKSIPLRRSLESSSFNIGELADGNTVLYVIIPADKLKTHYAWLRLVVTTAMKAVVRKPNKRVYFLLDECYALGYLPELEVALGTYAGYGITVWSIWQSLVQIQELYGKNWENFISNSSVIHAFGLNDHTTATYISEMIGRTSVASYGSKGIDKLPHGSSSRMLITPDEARRLGESMLVFIDNLPVACLPKIPYYRHRDWSQRAQPNPYYHGS